MKFVGMLINRWLSKAKRRLSDRGVATVNETLGGSTATTIPIDGEAPRTTEEDRLESGADEIMIVIMIAAGGGTIVEAAAARGTDATGRGKNLRLRRAGAS